MQEADLKALHILVIDDDADFLTIVEGMLRYFGVSKVTTATSGSDALTKMNGAARTIDCILCDMQMPQGNGLQLLKALRTSKIKAVRPDACFIFLTASGQPTAIQAAAQLDVNGYLVKPITREKLRAAIVKGRAKYFAVNAKLYEDVVVPLSTL